MDNTEKLINAVLSNGSISETLEEVMSDYSKRISDAITPVYEINVLAIIYVLEEYARNLRQMYPEAAKRVNALSLIFDTELEGYEVEVDGND